MRRFISGVILFLFYTANAAAEYNPWYFEIDSVTYRIQEENDQVDVLRYNKDIQAFEHFQHLSDYAQKIDYFMENVGRHFVSTTDESGHVEIFIWQYGDEDNPSKFIYWG